MAIYVFIPPDAHVDEYLIFIVKGKNPYRVFAQKYIKNLQNINNLKDYFGSSVLFTTIHEAVKNKFFADNDNFPRYPNDDDWDQETLLQCYNLINDQKLTTTRIASLIKEKAIIEKMNNVYKI